MKGIEMLNAAHEGNLVSKRSASIIIMLTDGQPNVGKFVLDGTIERVNYLTKKMLSYNWPHALTSGCFHYLNATVLASYH